MFHWICPECGGEVSPQARECAACEGTSNVTAAAEPAPVQERVAGAPREPAVAVPTPVHAVGKELAPMAAKAEEARTPQWRRALPEPEPARAPRVANAPLREPQAASSAHRPSTQGTGACEPSPVGASLPGLTRPATPAPQLAGSVDYTSVAASKMRASRGKARTLSSSVSEQISLPGPTLPHELTSLQAAGVARILVAGKQQAQASASSWGVSVLVAAAVMAATLWATFYAMPGLANVPAPAAKADVAPVKAEVKPDATPVRVPANPLQRVVEVTGIRFVTDLPGRSPQIHYLVVNHSNLPLMGVTVNVTLTAGGDAPLSQFAFRAPRLGPYESKEMISSIERFNRAVELPDWHELKADVQIVP